MKKVLFSVLTFVFAFGAATAQDGNQLLRMARSSFNQYQLDKSANVSKLQEARKLVDQAVSTPEVRGTAKGWMTRGEVYNALVGKDVNRLFSPTLDNSNFTLPPNSSEIAAEAVRSFYKASEYMTREAEKKVVQLGLTEAASYLNTIGNERLQLQDYAGAYTPLSLLLEVNEKVISIGGRPVLASAEDLANTRYVVAYCAMTVGNDANAIMHFEQLIAQKYPEPGIYSSYVNILMKQQGNENKILELLEAGNAAFPNNSEILFAEINFYLRINKLDELLAKLKQAIVKEPESVSLYSTLGNVYDNLFQREAEAGNAAAADEHFNNALSYYNQALKLRPDYPDVLYSTGALYFNKAAIVSKMMVAAEGDLSQEGIKRYEGLKAEMLRLFDQALPHFQKAESMNPNDVGTLTALFNIYRQKENFESAGIFKERLEIVKNGGQNPSSYFNRN